MNSTIQFIGRFHILILHLPIGILMVTSLAMLLIKITKGRALSALKPSIPILLSLGTVTVIFASVLGYLLSLDGGYAKEALDLHFWSAIALAVVATFITIVSYKYKQLFDKLSYVWALLLLLFVTITGHAGGNLTHGETYLVEHGPDFMKKAVGMELELAPPNSLAEAQFYGHIIKPILRTTCVSCHNKSKKEGGLDLSTYTSLLKGGRTVAVKPNNLEESELYKRITLPHGDKKFMPTDGKKPLTPAQVKIIASWINSEAKQKATIGSLKLSDKEMELLVQETSFSAHKVIVATDVDVSPLVEKGFYVNALPDGYGLDVSFYPEVGQKLTMDILQSLLPFKDQIIWLRLSRNTLDNQAMTIISQCTELKKLYVDHTTITDITGLKQLNNLELLNVYNTPEIPKNQLQELKKNNAKLNVVE